MSATTYPRNHALRLVPFEERFAHVVSRWVADREQLRLLAPSSTFPLSGERVCRWLKPGGRAFLLFDAVDGRPPTNTSTHAAGVNASPLGYGELNPMRGQSEHLWIGHVIVDPMRRGLGHGSALAKLLVDEAFCGYEATRVSLVVFPENVAAIRCYDRAGFSFVREERHRFGGQGIRQRLMRFELLRRDYLAQCGPNATYPSELNAK